MTSREREANRKRREAHRNPPPEEWFTAEGDLEIHEVAFDATAIE